MNRKRNPNQLRLCAPELPPMRPFLGVQFLHNVCETKFPTWHTKRRRTRWRRHTYAFEAPDPADVVPSPLLARTSRNALQHGSYTSLCGGRTRCPWSNFTHRQHACRMFTLWAWVHFLILGLGGDLLAVGCTPAQQVRRKRRRRTPTAATLPDAIVVAE